MTFKDLILSDSETLTRYFDKLFQVMNAELKETKEQHATVKTLNTDEIPTWFHSFVDYIKPSMIINIYSFFDFWLQEICKYYEKSSNMAISHKGIKGTSVLGAYHTYLTKYININLSAADAHYQHMNSMRRVRNLLIHNGCHAPQGREELKKLENIEGIEVIFGLIHIKDSYVWSSLEHAKLYLLASIPPH
jgi:hypothetical protein